MFKLKSKKLKNAFNAYIENQQHGNWLFETTYLIENDLDYNKFCEDIEFDLKSLIRQNKAVNKVKVELGIFKIKDEEFYFKSF